MKIKPKVYAEALTELMLLKKSAGDQEKIVKGFLKLLEKNGDIRKAKEILAKAQDLFIKKTGRRRVVLETARKADKKAFLKEIEMAGDIVEEKISPELVAGIKITINDEQLDFSLNKKLQNIFK